MKWGWGTVAVLVMVMLPWAQRSSAQDACAGIALAPGADIAAAVQSAPPGSTFCFAPGEYANVHLEPRTGDRYLCAPGAVFNGAGRTDGLMRALYGINDPRNATGVTLSGCTIRGYGSDSNYGAGSTGRGAVQGFTGWVVENNRFEGNAIAITFANNWGLARGFVLRNNVISGSSEMSLLVNGTGYTIEGNTIEGNGSGLDASTVNWYGSLKITCMALYDGTPSTCDQPSIIRGNTIRGNNGSGLWFDIAARGARIEGNTITGNSYSGIMCEICHDMQIVGNTLASNGAGNPSAWLWRGGQVFIANGSNVTVSSNRLYVTDATRGIIVVDEADRSPRTVSAQIVDNVVIYQTGAAYSGWDPIAGYSGASHAMSALSSTWDRTTYCGDAAQPHWYLDGPRTFAEWQARGFDANGRVVPLSDPACS